MSLHVKAALIASHDLLKTERLVLVAIAAHANRDGDAWPSVATIADYVGCSVRTVQRALVKLVQLGRLVVRKVAGIATRVYRLVVDGGDKPASGGDTTGQRATDQRAGGDTHGVSPEVEEHPKNTKKRAGARDWRRFLPKSKTTPTPTYPERRGAALPPAPGAERCPRHRGSLAHNCGPCRSERLAGDR